MQGHKATIFDLELYTIALEFERHLGSSAADVPLKIQIDVMMYTSNLAVSCLHKIIW